MKKKGLLMMAAACLLAATSCSEDLVTGNDVSSSNEIGFNTAVGTPVRAVETKISNLGKFMVSAFKAGKANYMNNVEYTTSDNGSSWTTSAGKFFWPVEGDLNFYGYAPAKPGASGTFKLDKDVQTLTDFVPFSTAAAQQDFVYAKSIGNNAANGTTGVELNFQHALTEISVAAKNSNAAYTVKVTGVKLGNVKTKGTFTFPSTANSAGSWTLSNAIADVGSYETTWSNATVLTNSASTLDEANVPFMLLPQQLEKSEKASEKAYLALKVIIVMQGGEQICDCWTYIGLNTNWEMGKHYTYIVDFSDGAGQDESGKLLISDKEMSLNVKVTPWNAKGIDIPEKVISGTSDGTFSYRLGGYYATKHTVTPDARGKWSIPVSKLLNATSTCYMFADTGSSLTSLNLSNFDTSNVHDMEYMFYHCSSLTSLDLGHFNIEKVTSVQGMFCYCEKLTTLDVNHLNTCNVTNMGSMFAGCEKLTTLNLSGWNTKNVTDMQLMFCNCHSLTSLNLSGWNTEKVTDMNQMFSGCNSLTSLDLSHFNTKNVTDIHSMFSGCEKLSTLDVSHLNTCNVTDMGYLFSRCNSLRSLDLSNFNTTKVTNMRCMFYGCSTLPSLDVSRFNTEKVTDMYAIFYGCKKLSTLDVSHLNTSNVTNMSLLFAECTSLTSLDLSGWDMNNVTNMENMFYNSPNLKTIRMVGCNEATINKVKAQLEEDGTENVTIVTK